MSDFRLSMQQFQWRGVCRSAVRKPITLHQYITGLITSQLLGALDTVLVWGSQFLSVSLYRFLNRQVNGVIVDLGLPMLSLALLFLVGL